MRTGGLKCSLFGFEICNTMTKSTRLQMSTFSYLKLNSLFRRWTMLGLPRGPCRRSRWFLVGSFHASVPVIRSLAPSPKRLRETIRTRRNTFLDPHLPVVLVRGVSTSVCSLAHPHLPSHLVSSLSLMRLLPAHAAPFGPIVAPLPGYSASCNHFEIRNPRLNRHGVAQLRDTLLHPSGGIRRSVILSERAQWTYTVRLTLEGVLLLISSKRHLLNLQYSFVRPSTYAPAPAQSHGYHQYKPAPIFAPAPELAPNPHRCSWNPIYTSRFFGIGISTWEYHNRYSPLADPATSRIKVTCIWPHTHISIPRQGIAHKCQSRPCTLLNFLTTCVYLGIITLTCDSRRTHKAFVALASLYTVWTIASVSVCLCA